MSELEGRILIVDDDIAFRSLAEATLGADGTGCVGVRTGEEGLKLLLSSAPILAVVDGLLPGMRGDELVLKLRELHPKVPVIFVSAFFRDMKSFAFLTRDVKVDALLHKPIDREELKATADRLLHRVPARPRLATPVPEPLEIVEGTQLADSIADTASIVAELAVQFLDTARQRSRTIRASHTVLMENSRAADTVKVLCTEAHRLRGSGTSFGFPEITRLGTEIEELLLGPDGEPLQELSTPVLARLSGLVEALGAKIDFASGTAPIATAADEARVIKAFLLDGNTLLSRSCESAAIGGANVRVFHEVGHTIHFATEDRPDAIFIAGDLPELDAAEACQKLGAAALGPLVLISRNETVEQRVRAVRLGAQGFVARPSEAASLLRLAREFSARRSGARLLAVDDDLDYLEVLAQLMAKHGVAVDPCPDPEKLFTALQQNPPQCVVLDVMLPGYTGLDLLRAIRADATWRRLPVVVVSGMGRKKDRLAALDAGADDFLQKPIDPQELSTRVLSQIDRSTQLERESLRDPLSGAFRRPYLFEECERALLLSRRYGRPLALLGFQADLETIRRDQGALPAAEVAAAIAAHLRIAFRASDVVARISDGTFAVLLHEASAEAAQKLLDQELSGLQVRSFEGAQGTFKVDMKGARANFPEVSGGAEALLSAVEQKLRGYPVV